MPLDMSLHRNSTPSIFSSYILFRQLRIKRVAIVEMLSAWYLRHLPCHPWVNDTNWAAYQGNYCEFSFSCASHVGGLLSISLRTSYYISTFLPSRHRGYNLNYDLLALFRIGYWVSRYYDRQLLCAISQDRFFCRYVKRKYFPIFGNANVSIGDVHIRKWRIPCRKW